MSDFGLLPEGFNRKRLPQAKAEIEADLRDAFGQNIRLEPETVFGQLVGTWSRPAAELWEIAEFTYLQFDPSFAVGAGLDGLAELTGITRQPAIPTTVIAAVQGDASTAIPAGSQAENSQTGDIYVLQEAVTITPSSLLRATVEVDDVQDDTQYTITINGTEYDHQSAASGATANSILNGLATAAVAAPVDFNVDGDALIVTTDDGVTAYSLTASANLAIGALWARSEWSAQEAGQLFLPVGALDEIATPVSGWDAVENLAQGSTGRNRETDEELRLRRAQSVSFPAQSVIDAIFARVRNIPDVLDAVVRANEGETTDSDGVPPQHIWVIVLGGDDEDIGRVIYETKAAGIGSFGDETVTITSDSGQDFAINFDRPTEIEVYITVEIVKHPGFPSDGETAIVDQLVQWGASNLSIGTTLKWSRLFTPINNAAPNFEVDNLFIGTASGPTGTDSIVPATDEILRIDESRIVVTDVTP